MLDGTVKTVLVDDSQVVANLMVVICTKIGKMQFYVLKLQHSLFCHDQCKSVVKRLYNKAIQKYRKILYLTLIYLLNILICIVCSEEV